jgi:hypothetical protein
MARFLCACGDQIRTSGDIPHPYEWLLIADRDVPDSAWEGETSIKQIYELANHAFKCPTCGRLWVFWDGFDADPKRYDPA